MTRQCEAIQLHNINRRGWMEEQTRLPSHHGRHAPSFFSSKFFHFLPPSLTHQTLFYFNFLQSESEIVERALEQGCESYLAPSSTNMSIILGWSVTVALGMGSHRVSGEPRPLSHQGKALERKSCKGPSWLDLISGCPISWQDCSASLWTSGIRIRNWKGGRRHNREGKAKRIGVWLYFGYLT